MATIGKKFIEPDKWESAWFSRLSPGQKLLYCYLWERADHSGVIEIIYPVWSAHIGQQIDKETLDKLIESVNQGKDRIIIFGDKILLSEYIRFQQKPDETEPLSGTHGFTKTIVRLLKGHGLYEEVKKRDPILFSDFEEKNNDSSVSKASIRLTQDYDKGLSKSKSQIGSKSGSTSGSPPPANGEKKESLSIVAGRCLGSWQPIMNTPLFSEQNLVEDKLREFKAKDFRVDMAEKLITEYLNSEKMRVKQTNDEPDLENIIKSFEVPND